MKPAVKNLKSVLRWGSLRTKIIAWSFVPTAIILVAVALVTFSAYQQVTEELVIERDRELIRLSAGQLATGLAEYTDVLASLALTADIRRSDVSTQRDALKAAGNRLAVFDGGVLILDTFGTVVAAEPERPEILGQDWSDRSYYRAILRSQISSTSRPVFSDIVVDGVRGAEVIATAVPIVGDQGEFRGVIAGMFRLRATAVSAFYGDIVRLRIGESGSTYLVDGAGRVIYHSDAERIGESFAAQPVVQRVLSGQVGAIRTRDFEDQDIVAGFAPVPGTSWGLVTQESWGALISGGRDYRQSLLLLLALGVIVPALVVAIGVRRITRPIRELISAAQEVAGGNFGQTITARTGDEMEELAEQFNLMSAQLESSYAQLEQRVADRTKELATLNAISAAVSRFQNLKEVLRDALNQTLEVLEIEAGGIYLVDEATGTLNITAQRGFTPEFIKEIDRLRVGEGFLGRTVESGEPIVISDISNDPRLSRKTVLDAGLGSLASAPLRSKGRVLGTLFAVTHGYREFTHQDVQLLTSIGHQIGVAVENARLFEAEHRRRQEATLLVEMARLVSGTLDLDEVLRLTAEYAVDVLEVHCCSIFLYNEVKGTLRPAAQIGLDDQVAGLVAGVEFIPGEKMRQTVFEDLQPLIVEDVPSNPHLKPRDLLAIQSALVVPIEVGGRRLGALQLGTLGPALRCFTAAEGELALAMANQAALAIENAGFFEGEQRRAEQFRVISEVGRRITSILAVDELLVQMAAMIQKAFDYYHVGIGLLEGDQVVYKVGAGQLWDDPEFQFSPSRLQVGRDGITGWVAETGEPLLAPDVSQEPRYVLMGNSQARSELAVPIEARGKVIGVLDVQSDHLDAFDETDLTVLRSLAYQAGVAIENAQLFEQAQRLAVLEERQRLARDLHDAVTQTLFSASLIAEIMPRLWERDIEEGRRRMGELRELTRGALAEMRTLLLELRPSALAEAELGDLLRQLAESVTGRARLPVALHVEETCQPPTEVKVALYRIAQESLNNAVKHAGSRQVRVDLCSQPEQVELGVSDDGRGFDPSGIPSESLGMGIMRERAQSIGATLTVESEIGRGTKITVVWSGE